MTNRCIRWLTIRNIGEVTSSHYLEVTAVGRLRVTTCIGIYMQRIYYEDYQGIRGCLDSTFSSP